MLNAYPLRLAVSSLPFLDHGDTVKFSRATARISLLGIALGCTAGILLLLVTCFLSSAQGVYGCAAIRYDCGSGVWWALFSVPTLLLLPGTRGFEKAQNAVMTEEREGLLTSEPTSEAACVVATDWSVGREVVDACGGLGNMLPWENV